MDKIINYSKCSGCSACKNICPTNAIIMTSNEEGFLYPKIYKSLCVDCGLCQKICPVNNTDEQFLSGQTAYAVVNTDKNTQINSSSGGIFTALAEKIVGADGVVFGARFDEMFNVIHDYTEDAEGLKNFQGSKYVQSVMGDSYKEVESFLEKGRKVLFSGTPCQVEGLLSYLRKDYENLITQDIICHGVPSPLVYRKYLAEQEKDFNSKIRTINFRTKPLGWKNYFVYIGFQNGESYSKKYTEDVYMQIFLKDLCLRPSCYNCSFKKLNKKSDITIADFWGVEKIYPASFDKDGVSLVIVNSNKGQSLFNSVSQGLNVNVVDLNLAIKYNPSMLKSANKPKKRECFIKKITKSNFYKTSKKFLKPSLKRKLDYKLSSFKNKFFGNR